MAAVCVVIPAFNEADHLPSLLRSIRASSVRAGHHEDGARGGRIRGRIRVVWQYAPAITRRTRELRRARVPVPAMVEAGVEGGHPS